MHPAQHAADAAGAVSQLRHSLSARPALSDDEVADTVRDLVSLLSNLALPIDALAERFPDPSPAHESLKRLQRAIGGLTSEIQDVLEAVRHANS